MLIKFYDNLGRFMYCKDGESIDPFNQAIKDHFFCGGSAQLENNTDRIGSHNALHAAINQANN